MSYKCNVALYNLADEYKPSKSKGKLVNNSLLLDDTCVLHTNGKLKKGFYLADYEGMRYFKAPGDAMAFLRDYRGYSSQMARDTIRRLTDFAKTNENMIGDFKPNLSF